MKHLAHTISFDQLQANLSNEVEAGNVHCQTKGDLRLYCYSKQCVFDRAWNDTTVLARGLILDERNQRIIALPFPKFFNYGEREEAIPDETFVVYEKLYGSLIIAFHYENEWHCATKGSFFSEQAQWAKLQLQSKEHNLDPNITYLFEAIYPENRIVVKYDYEALVLLGGFYRETGYEVPLYVLHHQVGGRAARVYAAPAELKNLLDDADALSANEEGWVIRFSSGYRLKVKGAEYKRLHAMVSRLTPLAVWEVMRGSQINGQALKEFKKDLPEEFWTEFDHIVYLLERKRVELETQIEYFHENYKELSDKSLGLILSQIDEPCARFLFPRRKSNSVYDFWTGKSRRNLFNQFRPTGNRLDNYRPSYSIRQIQEDH